MKKVMKVPGVDCACVALCKQRGRGGQERADAGAGRSNCTTNGGSRVCNAISAIQRDFPFHWRCSNALVA